MINVGIDIGGTNIKAALVDVSDDPVIAAKTAFPFGRKPCDELCSSIAAAIGQLLDEQGMKISEVGSIGLTVPGSLDQSGDVLLHAYNMGYHNVAVRPELAKHFPNTPVRMINDAKAAALAESKVGALKGCRTAILLTIGTGLGTGIILDGKVFNGGTNRGSEAGHLPFRDGDLPCTCGRRGCLEVYTAATWIANQGRARMGEVYADAKAVRDAAVSGDPEAKAIMDEYVDDLATAIAGLCNVFDPERIALGGGFSYSGDILYVPLRKLVAERNFYRAEYDIVPARFRNDAGVIGAALL